MSSVRSNFGSSHACLSLPVDAAFAELCFAEVLSSGLVTRVRDGGGSERRDVAARLGSYGRGSEH